MNKRLSANKGFGKEAVVVPDGLMSRMLSDPDIFTRLSDTGGRGILAHDMNGKIIFFNNEAEKIIGIRKKDVLGKNCNRAMNGIFNKEYPSSKGLRAAEKTGEQVINIKQKNGRAHDVKMTVSRMKDKNGNMLGSIASFEKVVNEQTQENTTGFFNMIGREKKMLDIYESIKDVAAYDCPVHISGETGTGKELAAKALHDLSPRREGPFVAINCGALPEGLVESELFGHVKGSFTGALRDKKGRFELADGGTLFLDEVAELSKFLQVKLLRFLQDGVIEKVGAEKANSVNVRVLSATNIDLKEEVQKGNFRDDLYYRLNVVPIHLPLLVERKKDIPLLVDHFLKQSGRQYGKDNLTITSDALELLKKYSWPGNIRELQNIIQFSIVKSRGGNITADILPEEIKCVETIQGKHGRLKKLEYQTVRDALDRAGGNKAKAARHLGVGRATLYRFIEEHPNVFKSLTV